MTRHRAPADLEEALEDLGIRIAGGNDDEVTAWCPGHMERLGREQRKPKWSVNRVSGLHNCWSCHYSGTFLELVMDRLFPNDVFRAARWLRQYGTNLARAAELQSFVARTSEEEADQIEALELVPETKLAMYAEVPDWALEARRLSRESVEHYGVRWNPDHESWIIPVREPTGHLLGWQEKWEKRRRFMNDPKDMVKSLCLFGLDVFPVGEPAVLLESPLDVCRLYTAGWEGGLSIYGSEVSKAQIALLAEVTDELVSALDDDDAGRTMAEELRVGQWKHGKLVAPGINKLFPQLRFFNYDRTDQKDIGNMDESDIDFGLREARHWSVARLGNSEQEKHRGGVHRTTQAVPAAARGGDGRPRPVPAHRRGGNRQDANVGRRRRGAR